MANLANPRLPGDDLVVTANGAANAPAMDAPLLRPASEETPGLVARYFREAERFPLLGAAEEKRLNRRLLRALTILGEGQPLVCIRDAEDRVRECELTGRQRRAWQLALACRRIMIQANLRLAVHIARQHQQQGLPIEDLIQEGNMGLIKAVERFDPARGFKISTYAYWWITEQIRRAIKQGRRLVRTPDHVVDEIRRLQAIENHLTQKDGGAPDISRLAGATGYGRERIEQLRRYARSEVSTASPMMTDGELVLEDTLTAPESDPVEQAAGDQDPQAMVALFLDQLNEREAEIIRRRFGLGSGEPETLQQLSDQLGISRERIRQIEKGALARLRENSAFFAHLAGN